MRILLVEESTDHYLGIRAHLRLMPHSMEVVENDHLAVEAFKTRRFDLVLIHIGTNASRGDEAVRAMRAWEVHSGQAQIPIIGLMDKMPDQAISSGCTAWLSRPVGSRQLFDCLNALRWPQNSVAWTGPANGGTPKRIQVRVDPQLKPMIPSFLKKRGADLAELKAALRANDLEAIRLTGHRLKGKGSGYGFPGISKVGDALDHAVARRDLFGIREAIEELESYLQRIELVD